MCLFKKDNHSLSLGSNAYEFVDLGLSVKWANKNVGSEYEDKIGTYFNYDEAAERYYELPTVEEVRELFEKCKIKYDKKRNGFEVVGVNGNKIFIPVSGERDGNAHYDGAYFWTCDSDDEMSNYYGAVYLANKVLKKVKTEIHPLRRSAFYINVREVKR